MSKKVIAIAFSDLHINLWAKFNNDNKRTLDHFRVLELIAEACKKHDCEALFCGDFLHKPESLDQELAILIKNQLEKLWRKYPRFRVYAIDGNHDLKSINRIDDIKSGWVRFFDNDRNIVTLSPKTPPVYLYPDIRIFGVPYIDHNVGLSECIKSLRLDKDYKNILLLHTDYPGAKDCDGRMVDSVENLNLNVLDRFDLVLCGHIHKPQRLSKKVYMVGAPLQQRRTDKDTELGYWKVYEDLSMEFVSLNEYFPRFIDVESEDDIKDDGNYYTVLPKKSSIEVNTKHKISKQLYTKRLAKTYMKEKGISDKGKRNLFIGILKKAES